MQMFSSFILFFFNGSTFRSYCSIRNTGSALSMFGRVTDKNFRFTLDEKYLHSEDLLDQHALRSTATSSIMYATAPNPLLFRAQLSYALAQWD